MHPACPNKKQNHLNTACSDTFSKPASLKRASLVFQVNLNFCQNGLNWNWSLDPAVTLGQSKLWTPDQSKAKSERKLIELPDLQGFFDFTWHLISEFSASNFMLKQCRIRLPVVLSLGFCVWCLFCGFKRVGWQTVRIDARSYSKFQTLDLA